MIARESLMIQFYCRVSLYARIHKIISDQVKGELIMNIMNTGKRFMTDA